MPYVGGCGAGCISQDTYLLYNTIIGKLKKLIKNPHHGRGGDIPQILAPWVETAIT